MSRATTELRDRWTPELIQRAAEAFRGRTVLTPFPPVIHDGTDYHDLRGLTIREPVRDLAFDRVDLSHARTDYAGQFIGITATGCLFVAAVVDTNLSGTFERCNFDGAKLGGATIFGGSSFTECTFVKADLRGTKGAALKFDRCDFTSANFRGTRLSESDFIDCRWDGTRFFHASLGSSKITRAGFPVEKGVQEGDLILPDVILDHVKWLD